MSTKNGQKRKKMPTKIWEKTKPWKPLLLHCFTCWTKNYYFYFYSLTLKVSVERGGNIFWKTQNPSLNHKPWEKDDQLVIFFVANFSWSCTEQEPKPFFSRIIWWQLSSRLDWHLVDTIWWQTLDRWIKRGFCGCLDFASTSCHRGHILVCLGKKYRNHKTVKCHF